jgi:hypothetical protein
MRGASCAPSRSSRTSAVPDKARSRRRSAPLQVPSSTKAGVASSPYGGRPMRKLLALAWWVTVVWLGSAEVVR